LIDFDLFIYLSNGSHLSEPLIRPLSILIVQDPIWQMISGLTFVYLGHGTAGPPLIPAPHLFEHDHPFVSTVRPFIDHVVPSLTWIKAVLIKLSSGEKVETSMSPYN
jgi:hypothetical protein